MGTSSHKKGFNLYMDARKGLPFTYKLAFFFYLHHDILDML